MSPQYLEMRLNPGQAKAASERSVFRMTFSKLVVAIPKGMWTVWLHKG